MIYNQQYTKEVYAEKLSQLLLQDIKIIASEVRKKSTNMSMFGVNNNGNFA